MQVLILLISLGLSVNSENSTSDAALAFLEDSSDIFCEVSKAFNGLDQRFCAA